MNKILIIILASLSLSLNSYSQTIQIQPISEEELDIIYGDSPEKATYRYDKFDSKIKFFDKTFKKSWYFNVIEGHTCFYMHLSLENGDFITIIVNDKKKREKVNFHYKYNCIIEYHSADINESLFKRGTLMSIYDLNALSTGNLSKMHLGGEDQYYKIIDIAIFSIENEFSIELTKIKK